MVSDTAEVDNRKRMLQAAIHDAFHLVGQSLHDATGTWSVRGPAEYKQAVEQKRVVCSTSFRERALLSDRDAVRSWCESIPKHFDEKLDEAVAQAQRDNLESLPQRADKYLVSVTYELSSDKRTASFACQIDEVAKAK